MDVSDLTCEYKYYLVVNKGVNNEAYWNQPLSQKCKFIFQVFYKKSYVSIKIAYTTEFHVRTTI